MTNTALGEPMPEEVELAYYLRIIWRRRLLILSGTVGCMLAALVVSLLLPKKYESSLQLKIGRVWNSSLDDSTRLAAIINSEPFLDKVRQGTSFKQTASQMKKTNIIVAQAMSEAGASANKDTLLVNVVTRGYTPEEAVSLATVTADLVIQEHQSRFEEWLNEHRLYEKKLENQIELVQNDIHELQGTLKRLNNPQVSAPAVILLQAQLEQKQVQLVGFVRELGDVKMNNSSRVVTENTRIILPAVQPENYVSPKIALNVTVAGFLGVIAALVMVFMAEYLNRVNSKQRAVVSATD
jgi:uncharacterized protein involved in exopolysaccharide biosynthesis